MYNSIDDDNNYSNTNTKYTDLTTQAKLIIDGLERSKMAFIMNFHEHYSYGDCDDMGPTEHFWTLYVVMENHDTTMTNLKYYREVFEMQHEVDSNIFYESCETNDSDNKIFAKIKRNHFEVAYKLANVPMFSLTPAARRAMLDLSNSVNTVYINEYCESGDCGVDGLIDQMWTLIIVTKNNDELSYHKYYRKSNEVLDTYDKNRALIDYVKVDLDNCD
jgi:hypothetical protein